ncbi:hypothetical protein AXX17_AT4G01950 [Arabidopsis thaliana]|uniref:Transmembrane protein n=1 Tax=Arabidopsis thaliana TaxID=3702 RepID=A0A178V4F1_ARATH|nr:hypothetical protein AXX17_AT4G01950 [Arabidopsis thaliana]
MTEDKSSPPRRRNSGKVIHVLNTNQKIELWAVVSLVMWTMMDRRVNSWSRMADEPGMRVSEPRGPASTHEGGCYNNNLMRMIIGFILLLALISNIISVLQNLNPAMKFDRER